MGMGRGQRERPGRPGALPAREGPAAYSPLRPWGIEPVQFSGVLHMLDRFRADGFGEKIALWACLPLGGEKRGREAERATEALVGESAWGGGAMFLRVFKKVWPSGPHMNPVPSFPVRGLLVFGELRLPALQVRRPRQARCRSRGSRHGPLLAHACGPASDPTAVALARRSSSPSPPPSSSRVCPLLSRQSRGGRWKGEWERQAVAEQQGVVRRGSRGTDDRLAAQSPDGGKGGGGALAAMGSGRGAERARGGSCSVRICTWRG